MVWSVASDWTKALNEWVRWGWRREGGGPPVQRNGRPCLGDTQGQKNTINLNPAKTAVWLQILISLRLRGGYKISKQKIPEIQAAAHKIMPNRNKSKKKSPPNVQKIYDVSLWNLLWFRDPSLNQKYIKMNGKCHSTYIYDALLEHFFFRMRIVHFIYVYYSLFLIFITYISQQLFGKVQKKKHLFFYTF